MMERELSDYCKKCVLLECCNVRDARVKKCKYFFGDLCETCIQNHACPLQTKDNKSKCKWYEPVQIRTSQELQEEM
jgi:hypothetical protein